MAGASHNEFDFAVIGGGLVGAAIAWGLARRGRSVAMLDEGDIAFRASRGNFALIWVQIGYCQDMTDKALHIAGLFLAPIIMLVGLWLCLEGLEHGKLSGIFSIGPFVAVAGALWFVSDLRFE